MQGSRSPLFRVGLSADSSWYTVNVNTWTWEQMFESIFSFLAFWSFIVFYFICFFGSCAHLVSFDQNPLHLFEQVLQVPAAQSLDDLHQSSSRHVADLLEAVSQQNADFDQDPGRERLVNYVVTERCFRLKTRTRSCVRGEVGLHDVRRQGLH